MTRPSIRSAGASKQFRVFDFTEDKIEQESKKLLRRFGSPRSESSSAIDKYEFLRYFAQDSTRERKEPISRVIDIEAGNEDWTQEKEQAHKSSDASPCVTDKHCPKLEFNPANTSSDGGARKEGICGVASYLQSALLGSEKQRINVISDDGCEKCKEVFPEEGTSGDISGYGTSDPIDVISDDYRGRTENSSSTSTVSLRDEEGSSGEEDTDCTSGAHEIDKKNLRVLLIPDVMIHGDIYCTKSKLTFSISYIEVEGLAVNATKGTFRRRWPVEDIFKIESEWYLEVETAIVNLLIKSRNPKGDVSANETSGVDLLKFAVYDPDWSVALEAIKSLDSRYKDVWFDISAVDGESEETAVKGQNSQTLITNPYESFEDIVYPQGDPDAVLISEKDIEFLRPQSFINDTIIDFYIRYLKDQIQPEEQCRFHFFNCFFFRKLANIDKGSRSTSGGREAFERVQKWTKKVDIFVKDYIFIPVNFSLHWSLIVICHPGESIHFNDDEAQNSERVPCILHMDSIKGSHRGLKSIFPSYLAEEWKERHGDKTNDSSRSFNLQFIPLEVPQQENSYDCGLFLLHYLELFLRQAPVNFNPSIISKSAIFLTRNWFPPAEASFKRGYIRELLYSLRKGHSRNSVDCRSTLPSSRVSNKVDKEEEIKTVKETCSSRKPSDGSSSITSSILQEIDTVKETCSLRKPSYGSSLITTSILQGETSPSTAHRACVAGCKKSCGEPSDLILRKESFYKGGYDPKASKYRRVFMSPIEEVQEIGENATTYSPLGSHNFTKMVDEANTSGTTLVFCDDRRWVETYRNEECAVYIKDSDEEETVPKSNVSQDSSEVQVNKDDDLLLVEEPDEFHKTRELQSPSTSIEMLSHLVVEDSLELESINKEVDEIKDCASSLGCIVVLSSEERRSGENSDLKEGASVSARSRAFVSQPLKKQITKRQKTRF